MDQYNAFRFRELLIHCKVVTACLIFQAGDRSEILARYNLTDRQAEQLLCKFLKD
ncbi:MAG: hypothetical protein ACRD1R_08385 [Acidobacteriota bacterium]